MAPRDARAAPARAGGDREPRRARTRKRARRFFEDLQVLDLESNSIADPAELAALGTCDRLACLTLLGNPVSLRADYAAEVRKHVPRLEALDDKPLGARAEVLPVEDLVATPPRPAEPSDGDLDEFIRQETEMAAGGADASPCRAWRPSCASFLGNASRA